MIRLFWYQNCQNSNFRLNVVVTQRQANVGMQHEGIVRDGELDGAAGEMDV